MVCLNEGERLHKTIGSILEQTEEDYEIIVKDGGSTDGSVEELAGVAGFEKDSSEVCAENGKIKIYREKDTGIYDAMNQAVRHASGKYIFFLNCGDYLYQKDVLSRIKHLMEAEENRAAPDAAAQPEQVKTQGKHPRIYYGNIQERMTGALVQSNPKMDDFGCYRNVPCHQACFYDRRLLVSRGFDTSYLVRADYEHFLWCFYKARAHTVYLPVTVASYEGGGFSETKENVRRSAREHRQIVRKYMPLWKIWEYQLLMFVTLAPVRTYLSRSPVTAGFYQTCKGKLYEGYRRLSGKER